MSEPALRITRPHRPGQGFFDLLNYHPYPTQRRIHESRALFRVANLGRQVGKSELAAVEAAFELCVVPGSEGWIVAPIFDQAEVIFQRTLEKVEAAAAHLRHLKIRVVRGAKLKIEVTHFDRDWREPGAIAIGKAKFNGKSAQTPDHLRSATLTYLIVDEAASCQQVTWTQALQPMLSTTQGWVLFLSTPKGLNWFYDIYKLGERDETGAVVQDGGEAWESFASSSWDANPTVPRAWYENKRRITPDLEFRQEYGAEFVSNSGSVFQAIDTVPRIEVNEAWSDAERRISAEPNLRHAYVIGADFGRLNDFSVFTVLDLDDIPVTQVASYRYGKVDWESQLNLLKLLSDRYNTALVIGDNNGVGEPLEGWAATKGIPFQGLKFTGTLAKSETLNHLALGMEYGAIRIQNDAGLLHEMRMFQYTRTESGILKMGASGRNHDDRVISLALAYSVCTQAGAMDSDEFDKLLPKDDLGRMLDQYRAGNVDLDSPDALDLGEAFGGLIELEDLSGVNSWLNSF